MRKMTFIDTLFYGTALLSLAFGTVTMPVFAQVQSPSKGVSSSTVAMPQDPLKLISLARKFNGLNVSGFPPWHIKVTFTRFDVMGKAIDHGTYEEFWASPNKRKYNFAGVGFTSTVYHDGKKVLVAGTAQDEVPDIVWMVRLGFVDPLPFVPETGPQRSFHLRMLKPTTTGGVPLSCLSGAYDPAPGLFDKMLGFNLCFDTDKPVLRVSSLRYGVPVIRNDLFIFNGRYVPRELEIGEPGRVELTAHLETLEELKSIDASEFEAPPNAVAPEYFVLDFLSEAEVRKLQTKFADPQYPLAALAAHVSGTVHVQATISVKGQVRDLHVIDGPRLLQQAALDAVGKYQFKAYRHRGEPSEVITMFTVDFHEPVDRK